MTDRGGHLAAIFALLTVLAACSPGNAANQPAEARTIEDGTVADAEDAVDATTTGSSVISDRETGTITEPTTATAFRLFILEADNIPPDVITFAGATTDDELNGLATTACRLVEPDMSQAELGTVSLTMHNESPSGDLTASEFSLVFGALAGLQCPERLPIDDRTADRPAPAEGIAAFRDGLAGFWPTEHPVQRFIDRASDERLEMLRLSACAATTVELSTTEFGLVALDHYDRELTDTEREQIGPNDYAEVFGAVIGWFCPERLPTIG